MGWVSDPKSYVKAQLREVDRVGAILTKAERKEMSDLLFQIAALDNPVAMVAALSRLSLDKQEGAGLIRQTLDELHLAVENNLAIVQLYIDADRSASRFATRVRERYVEAIALVIDGELDGLVAYNLDRLWRMPAEAEAIFERVLIGRAKAWTCQGVKLFTADDVDLARNLVRTAANESEGNSRRTRRAMEMAADRGVPHGGPVPYGRHRDKDDQGHSVGSWSVNKAEAKVVREACRRVLAGEQLSAIAADFNRRGIQSRSGKPWRHTTVRSMVTSPHIAGLRSWEPTEVVKNVRRPRGPRTVRRSEQLKPIVDEAVWLSVTQFLQDPARTTTVARGGHARRWLSTGFLVCGECGAALGSKSGRTRDGATIHSYSCRGCQRVRRKAEAVDEYLTAAVIDWIARVGPTPSEPSRLDKATAELADVRGRRGQVAKLFTLGQLDFNAYTVTMSELGRRESELSALLDDARGSSRKRLPQTRDDIEAEWAAAELAGRRELIVATGLEVVVSSVGKGRHPRYAGLSVRRRGS